MEAVRKNVPIERRVMNTLKNPVGGYVPAKPTRTERSQIEESEHVAGTWFAVIALLLLSLGAFYLLRAKVSGAWPFSY